MTAEVEPDPLQAALRVIDNMTKGTLVAGSVDTSVAMVSAYATIALASELRILNAEVRKLRPGYGNAAWGPG